MKLVERRRFGGTAPGSGRFRGFAARPFAERSVVIDETSIVTVLVEWAQYTKNRDRHASKLGKHSNVYGQIGGRGKRADRYVKHFVTGLKARSELLGEAQRQSIVNEIASRLVQVTVAKKAPQRIGAVSALIRTLADDRLVASDARRDLAHLFKVLKPALAPSQPVTAGLSIGVLLENLSPAGRRAVRGRKELLSKARELEEETLVTFLPRNVSGIRLEDLESLSEIEAGDLKPRPEAVASLKKVLLAANLTVVYEDDLEVVAKGSARNVQKLVGIPLALFSARGPKPREPKGTVDAPLDLYVTSKDGHVFEAPGELSDFVDHIVFFPPARRLALASVSGVPPRPLFPHLTAPHILAMLGCPPAGHADGVWTGKGVKVAIVDTGVEASHPALLDRVNKGAKISGVPVPVPPPKSYPPLTDMFGHGTAMAWNVLTCAPKAEIVSIHDSPLPNASLSTARDSDADIVVCCFDLPYHRFRSVELRIREMVRRGKVVLAAAGNGSQAFPGNMDEVISIGGVYQDPSGQRFASGVASGYTRVHLQGVRTVPDVCGPCGDKPPGVYFPMPCPPGSDYDRKYGAQAFHLGDGMGTHDGWWFGSGTSGATSLIAGVCALLIEKATSSAEKPAISTNFVKNLLQNTAAPVTQGKNAMGNVPNGIPNDSVGYGLVDATSALGLISGP